jgi:GDP-L-fucose synthase
MNAAYNLTGKRVWVAGHDGMVGSALMRRLQKVNCTLLTVSRRDLDLTRQREVEEWVAEQRAQAVFLAAAKVGGIVANESAPVDFLYDNVAIATNVMHAAAASGVEKLLFLGSSCIYPKFAPQPIKEEALLTGPLEPTNQWYAVAKIAGLKLCQAYRSQRACDFNSAMPSAFGWKPKIELDEGIASTYRWFLENIPSEKPNHPSTAEPMPERLN